MNGRWHTREDVLEDLYVATGSAEIDELCFVYGERPPPQSCTQLDDEMKTMFGEEAFVKKIPDKMVEPDLKGIVSMLRMVEQSEDECRTEGPELQPNDIIYISKLNPTVKEFVPKSLIEAKTSTIPDNSESKTSNNVVLNNDEEKKQEHKENNEVNNIEVTNRDNYVKNDEDDKTLANHDKVIENQLKDKICDAAQHDTFHHKKEKNAAIAALLKLYSKQPSTKPIKLYTPQFFEESKAKDFKGTDEDSSTSEENESKIDETNLIGGEDNPKENIIHEEEKLPITIIEEPSSLPQNEEIQESIEKVTNWFNGVTPKPKKIKSPEPILQAAQIGYKRKETISPASNRSSMVDKKIPRPVETYKPSQYAKELREKYAAKKKEMEEKQVSTIWDKLDQQLKKKDEEILAKRNEENNM